MNKKIESLKVRVATQEAHILRMIAVNQPAVAVRVAKRIAFVLRAELECLQAGKEYDAAAMNAASAAARKACR